MQYMRAHGNTPGPTQRPLLTGAVSGFLAAIPSSVILCLSGAHQSVADALSFNVWLMVTLDIVLLMFAGMLYAAIFKRAANDCAGGWLFGISYGFLLWMLGPVTVWQLITSRPVAIGRAAMGLFGAQLLFGLALGIVYPRIHKLVQMNLKGAPALSVKREF